jgi:hypothetical protein
VCACVRVCMSFLSTVVHSVHCEVLFISFYDVVFIKKIKNIMLLSLRQIMFTSFTVLGAFSKFV